MIRGPIRTLAGERKATWPTSIVGARCPDCGRWVGSLVILMYPDPLGLGGELIDLVSGICQRHGRVIATGWTPRP